MSRLLSWFATKNGKIFTRSCVGVAIASTFSFQIIMNGPFLEKYRQIVQLYRYAKPKPLSSKVQLLIDDVLKDSKLSEEDQKKLTFFNVISQDLFHAGGTNSPWGAIVGIPFTFEEFSEINFSELRMAGKESTIDWLIEGQELIEALRISDNAKKFALLREIHSCNFQPILENSVFAAGTVYISAQLARKLNIKFDALKTLEARRRFSVYFICYAFGFLLYKCFKDPLQHLRDKDIDKLTAQTGPEYIDGGIEFYTKAIEKNKAFTKLTGSKAYDEHGNEDYYIFTPKLPFSKRLKYLKEIKKKSLTTSHN